MGDALDPGWPTPTESDWIRCQEIAREHGRTFYLASSCMTPQRRRAIRATYAWCRIADDIVDGVPTESAGDPADALARWEAEIDRPTDPVAIAFAAARHQYNVPTRPVRDLIAGARMDLQPGQYESWEDLRVYCYHVAGTVGLMVAPILGCTDEDALPHAADLGIAMQLTNILRDVAEDAATGRLYLPLDEIADFGCDPESILAGKPDGRFRDLIAFQIERARGLYASAMRGVPALSPSGRIATLAASRLYARILDCIEEMDHDVFRGRAYVRPHQKFAAVPGVAGSALRMSLTPRQVIARPFMPRAIAGAMWWTGNRLDD